MFLETAILFTVSVTVHILNVTEKQHSATQFGNKKNNVPSASNAYKLLMIDKSFPDQQKGTMGGTFNIKPTKITNFFTRGPSFYFNHMGI